MIAHRIHNTLNLYNLGTDTYTECKINQGFQGIRQWSKKLMYIPNDFTPNYPLCRLKLVVETFEHST